MQSLGGVISVVSHRAFPVTAADVWHSLLKHVDGFFKPIRKPIFLCFSFYL